MTMWDEIVSMAMNNGIWAVLFCLLFLYEIKDSRKREQKYQDTVSSLTASVESIKDVKNDCADIRDDCAEIKGDCADIKRDVKNDYSEIRLAITGINRSPSTKRRQKQACCGEESSSQEVKSYEA